MRTLHISSRSQWENALSRLETWLEEQEVSMSVQQNIFIAFDEIVSNIFHHNEQDFPVQIDIQVDIQSSSVTLAFKDNCKLFNPLEATNTKENDIGGWGIDIVLKLMDVTKYEIVNGMNCLTIQKNIV